MKYEPTQTNTPAIAGRSTLLLPLFFLSGTGSLIFQTVWQRLLVFVFGASAPATAAILTSFFLGMALGSRWVGAFLHRFKGRSTLTFFAILQIWIGLGGIAVPYFLRAADALQIHFLNADGGYGSFQSMMRFALVIVTVLPATLAMGGTVPVMNKCLLESGRAIGRGVALAYGINTLGAVLGCLGSGFIFIRYFGNQNTLYGAAGISFLVAMLTFLFHPASSVSPTEQVSAAHSKLPSVRAPLFIFIYAAAGFLAIAYEIVWMRLLGIYNTSSVTTFTLALSVYLLGFSTGSMVLFPALVKKINAPVIFALSHAAVGFLCLASLPLIYRFPELNKTLIEIPAALGTLRMSRVISVEAFFSFVVMFMPTVFMGLAYPALCQFWIEDRADADRESGYLYFVGTAGSALGAVAAGIILVPLLGLRGTFGCLCLASIVLALLTLALLPRGLFKHRALFMAGLAVSMAAASFYAISSEPFLKQGRQMIRDGRPELFQKDSGAYRGIILRHADGSSASVTVLDERYTPDMPSMRRLYIDSQLVASTDPDARVDAKMLAHLPLLLHPDPKSALTVGFGSGGTSHSMTLHNIDVDAVEIEPEVIRSAGLFDRQNFNVLTNARFRVVINDARHYLHMTDKRYDVISTDVTNLQYKQNGNLYTEEYFELMKSRLREGGIACAWVPMGAVTPEEFKILMNTFKRVYPHTSVWYMNNVITTFALFIGTPKRLTIDMERLRAGFLNPGVQSDLAEIGIANPFQFISFLHLDEEGVDAYVGEAAIHSDDRPILEFTSPLSFYRKSETFAQNLKEVFPLRPKDFSRYVNSVPSEDLLKLSSEAVSSEERTKKILAAVTDFNARVRSSVTARR